MGLINFRVQAESRIDVDLINTCVTLAKKLNTYCDYNIQPYSQKSLDYLKFLSEDQKQSCHTSLLEWGAWLSEVEPETETLNESANKEVFFAQKALRFFGLKVSSSYWKTVAKDQILEIYGLEMKQQYRSLNFFKFSGYSLLDIAVFEWFKLWERPKLVIDNLMKESAEVIQNRLPVMSSAVPEHLLLEVMNSNEQVLFQPRACEMKFHNYGVVTDAVTGETKGIICSASGHVIARGGDTFRISTF